MHGQWDKDELKGIIPRTLEKIFQIVDFDNEFSYTLSISYLQIYMEMV